MPDDALDILIIDDEPSIRKMLTLLLESHHQTVTAASSPKDALAALARQTFDLAFLDLRLGTQNGLDLIPELLKISPWLRIVVITAYATINTAVEAIRRGAMDYLPKPFESGQVELMVKRVQELRQLESQIAALRTTTNSAPQELDISSRNPAMQAIYHRARQAARSDATILLRGESGTGKTLLARLIHQWSPRAGKPFAVVSCPSLSPELLESELFGHAKGAFTGAVRDNPGRIAASDGGTLFLDEIGDLPLPLQPKLLRFLQDRQYERVGESHTRHADVRIITATNVNLETAVAENRFREDLLYRLNVVQFQIPPLRERREDILPLADRLLAHLTATRPTLHFSPEARHLLETYPWPGNVRELRNIIERATIFTDGPAITPETLNLAPTNQPLASPALGKLQSLDAMEEQHIRHIIAHSKSLEEAAALLNIDIATLWRKRKKYGI